MEYLKRSDFHQQLIDEHEEIIETIESGQKDRAVQVVCQHVDNQVEAVMDTIRMKK